MLRPQSLFLLLAFALFGYSNTSQAEWFRQERAIMGTSVSVELWHENKQRADNCIQQVMDNMQRINNTMSPFKPDSELSQLNLNAAKAPVAISKELFQLIKQANKISALSNGSFDITFASVGYLYDYRKEHKPTPQQLKKLVAAINYKHIQLDDKKRTVRFAHPDVRIDLGGIAKGHAVDQGISILQQCGVQHALVSAGGDSQLLGDKRGRPWMTGIRHPRQKGKFAIVIPLSNTAVSTSGDYERFFIEDGVRYHHILAPSSGKPAKRSRSVTVLGPDSTTTDALSTAFFVMGPEHALRLAESLSGIDAIIIDTKGNTHYTNGLLKPKKSP